MKKNVLISNEDNFLKDRKIEKETYAIINYFQLFEKAYLIQDISFDRESVFQLLDGPKSLNRLILDCQEQNINLLENNIRDLLKRLEDHVEILKSITSSNSIMKDEAIQLAEIILKKDAYYFKSECNIAENAYLELCSFPLSQESLEKLHILKEKQKKIGER